MKRLFLRTASILQLCAAALIISLPAAAQHGATSYDVDPATGKLREAGPGQRFIRAFPLAQFPPLLVKDEANIKAIGQVTRGVPGSAEFDPAAPTAAINPVNPAIPAGFTFLGQFLDHDVTSFGPCEDLNADGCNRRTGSLDLDSVYGFGFERTIILLEKMNGPGAMLEKRETEVARLYETVNAGGINKPTGRFLIASRTNGIRDLVRNCDVETVADRKCAAVTSEKPVDKTAIIGDPRNDENTIVSQIHLKFLEAHNIIYNQRVKTLRGNRDTFNRAAFEYARRTLTEHYQALIRDDYLARTINDRNRNSVLAASFAESSPSKFHFYPSTACSVNDAAIPHEFSAVAFRFGHSQIRGGYALSSTAGAGLRDLFKPELLSNARLIDWSLFFETLKQRQSTPTDPKMQESKLIDTVLSPGLMKLTQPGIPRQCRPGEQPGTHGCDPKSDLSFREQLASRNVDTAHGSRGIGLPSGVKVAEELRKRAGVLRVQVLGDAQLRSSYFGRRSGVAITETDPNATQPTQESFRLEPVQIEDLPFWLYVLAEAEIQERGTRLGDVGSIIVGETFMALLSCDERSIIGQPWVPTLPRKNRESFAVADLIDFVISNEAALK
jgi:hypothetical protein